VLSLRWKNRKSRRSKKSGSDPNFIVSLFFFTRSFSSSARDDGTAKHADRRSNGSRRTTPSGDVVHQREMGSSSEEVADHHAFLLPVTQTSDRRAAGRRARVLAQRLVVALLVIVEIDIASSRSER